MEDKEKLELEEKIEELEAVKGRHTELVSVTYLQVKILTLFQNNLNQKNQLPQI